MKNTYRSIFKWGNPETEAVIDEGVIVIAQKYLGLKESDLQKKFFVGEKTVHLEKKSNFSEAQIIEFEAIFGKENVHTGDYMRASFTYGKYYAELLKMRFQQFDYPPDIVVQPRNELELTKLIQICNQQKIAVTPFGGKSSVTCGAQTPKGGVAIDLTKHFNKVITINKTNFTVTVEAGIFGPEFEKILNNAGFTCGHFPQSFEYSTVGGWVSARGAGQASTGYGKIEDMVLSIKVITPAGTIETQNFPADAQGWDLKRIFMGAEGTLGVITQVCMKIHKFTPQNTLHKAFIFKTFHDAVEAMRCSIQNESGKPHLFRISDPEETDIAFKMKHFDNTFSDKFLKFLGYETGKRCLMFVSVDGEKCHNKVVMKNISRFAKLYHGFSIGGKPTKQWLAQRFSGANLRDPLMDAAIMTDTIETSVNWDNLFQLWQSAYNYLKTRPNTIAMTHISHVYESGANLYFTFLGSMKKGEELREYEEYHKGLVETILQNGGSLSHHHGIGRTLSGWLPKVLGDNNFNLMKAIKNHLDPCGIMNPGALGF